MSNRRRPVEATTLPSPLPLPPARQQATIKSGAGCGADFCSRPLTWDTLQQTQASLPTGCMLSQVLRPSQEPVVLGWGDPLPLCSSRPMSTPSALLHRGRIASPFTRLPLLLSPASGAAKRAVLSLARQRGDVLRTLSPLKLQALVKAGYPVDDRKVGFGGSSDRLVSCHLSCPPCERGDAAHAAALDLPAD
jgi:hypothetical protein